MSNNRLIAILFGIVLILLFLCVLERNGPEKRVRFEVDGPDNQITVKTDKSEYQKGEPVLLIIYNGLNESVTFEGGHGCDGRVYSISQSLEDGWKDLPLSCGYCAALRSSYIEPKSGLVLPWDQRIFRDEKNYNGDIYYADCNMKQASKGLYKIKLIGNHGRAESNSFKII